MRIWICLESLKPVRWAVRYGNKWKIVKRIVSNLMLITQSCSIQPKCYLAGYGSVRFKNGTAFITASPGGKTNE